MIESACAARLAAEEQEHPVLPAALISTKPGCHAGGGMSWRSKLQIQRDFDRELRRRKEEAE